VLRAISALFVVSIVYFQAKAITTLLGDDVSTVAHAEQAAAWPMPSAPPPPPRRSAKPIFERNPFDSITGPLTGRPLASVLPAHRRLDLHDPLSAPRCDEVRIYSTAESTDPTWSTAIAQLKESTKSEVVRVGDRLGDLQVAYIGYNRTELSPAAWFVGDGELCQSLVFSERPRFKSTLRDAANARATKRRAKARKKRAKKASKRRKKRGKRPPRVPRDIASKVKRTGEGQYRIDRSVIDELLEKGPRLMRSTKMVPVKKGGRIVGMRVSNVGKGTLLSTLGVRNGDQIRSINGFEISNPEKALRAYARLRSASDISIQLQRGKSPVTLDYHIR
jgi:general secretion pathway protein C